MLKARQILGLPSGSIRRKRRSPGNGFGLSFRDKQSSLACCPCSFCHDSTPRTPSASLLLPVASVRNTVPFRYFRISASRSESGPDGLSSPSVSPSVKLQQSVDFRTIKFCQFCGGPTKPDIPAGEVKMRAICTLCGKVAYQNPKMVVGCLVEHEKKVLLCKRKIPPSSGLWTLPAGFLEIGESAIEGAMRETLEEAGAQVEVLSPFAQLDIPLIGQTYIIFLGKLEKPHFSPGPETLECRLYTLDDIPFDSMAFSSMVVTLNLYAEDMRTGRSKFHYGTINKRPGARPSDVHSYTLGYHMEC